MGSEISGAASPSAAPAAAQQLRPLARLVAHQRADVQRAVLLLELAELGDAVDVDERPRRGEAELHQRDQALPAGEDLRVFAVLLEQGQRLVEGRRREVVEAGWVHEPPPNPQ